MSTLGSSLYQVIEVDPCCSTEELRAAYRTRARALHPDTSGRDDGGRSMSELNEAWRVLSDPTARMAYDRELLMLAGPGSNSFAMGHDQASGTNVETTQSRSEAWVIGVQAQVGRLSLMAGRSAAQTLLLKSPRASRDIYGGLVDLIVEDLKADTKARVRAARAAGAAPLDLGVAATLIGIRTLADRVRRQASLGVTNELLMTAELLDRMWDVLAHELPTVLETALGSNPNVARTLTF